MAEKDDKPAASRADAVRGAAVQAFQATAGQAGVTRERAQELADELAGAAGRVMAVLDELRPATADDLRSLRADLRALEQRVAALEGVAEAVPPTRKPPARKATTRTAAKASAKKAAAKPPASAASPAAAKKASPARQGARRAS